MLRDNYQGFSWTVQTSYPSYNHVITINPDFYTFFFLRYTIWNVRYCCYHKFVNNKGHFVHHTLTTHSILPETDSSLFCRAESKQESFCHFVYTARYIYITRPLTVLRKCLIAYREFRLEFYGTAQHTTLYSDTLVKKSTR